MNETGESFLVVGHWISVFGRRTLDIGFWSSDIGYRFLVVGHWLSVFGHRTLDIGHFSNLIHEHETALPWKTTGLDPETVLC